MGLFDKALKIMDEQKDNTGFEPVPEGDYSAMVTSVELKPTKKGDGQRLNITFEINGGKQSGCLVFNGLNVLNPNDEAVAISLGDLRRLCETVGADNWFENFKACDTWDEAEKLIDGQLWDAIGNTQLMIRVKVKEDKSGQYGPSNVITKYATIEAAKPAAKSTEKKAPWAK